MRSKRVRSAVLAAVLAGFAGGGQGASDLSASARSVVEGIESQYSVRIRLSLVNPGDTRSIPRFHASPAPADEVERYLPILREELSKLPRNIFHCAEVRDIALLRDIEDHGQSRAGVPLREVRTLALDVSGAEARAEYKRWTFHHELFHMIDMAQSELLRLDQQWASLNPATFVYGPGGDRVYHDRDTAYKYSSPPPGFVTLYATMGAEEDKAEVFAAMLMRPDWFLSRSATDSVIQAKVALIQERLQAACGWQQRS
jgi:hypothetical protein